MSDLFCPTILVLARSGSAEHEHERASRSDDGGSLTPAGRTQARSLAQQLSHERLAAVWCSDLSRAVQTAEIVAATLSVDRVTVTPGLREISVGGSEETARRDDLLAHLAEAWSTGDLRAHAPGGESGTEVRERLRRPLELLVDQFRGECVLAVCHEWTIRFTAMLLCDNGLRLWHRDLAARQAVRIRADADGWRVETWADQQV